jgi:hypothetical protein
VTSSLALSPAESGPDDASGRGRWRDRVRPDAKHSELLPVEGNGEQRRVELELETEDTIDPIAMEELVNMKPDVERGSQTWKLVFDEFVMGRLRDRDIRAYARELRRRGLHVPGGPDAASGGRG